MKTDMVPNLRSINLHTDLILNNASNVLTPAVTNVSHALRLVSSVI